MFTVCNWCQCLPFVRSFVADTEVIVDSASQIPKVGLRCRWKSFFIFPLCRSLPPCITSLFAFLANAYVIYSYTHTHRTVVASLLLLNFQEEDEYISILYTSNWNKIERRKAEAFWFLNVQFLLVNSGWSSGVYERTHSSAVDLKIWMVYVSSWLTSLNLNQCMR